MSVTETKSLWSGHPYWLSVPAPRIATLRPLRDIVADVAVVGAGVTGAVAAAAFARAGYRVVILDRRGPLAGSTSASTALLQYDLDVPLTLLAGKIGLDKAVRAWRRSRLAHESLIARSLALGISCDLRRRDALYLEGNLLDAAGLRREAEARARAGLFTHFMTSAEVKAQYGIGGSAALLARGDYQVNPRRFVTGFLRVAMRDGARLYAPATVDEVSSTPYGAVHLRLREGPEVRARHAVFATGYEVLKGVVPRRKTVVSSWAFATAPQAGRLWRDQVHIWQAADPYVYIRSTPDGRVLCGGGDAPFSGAAARDALTEKKIVYLQGRLARLLPQIDTTPEYAWAGCFGQTPTGLPLIGPVARWPRCHAIMAFGGNGITFSQLGAEVVMANIQGRPDPDADLFAL